MAAARGLEAGVLDFDESLIEAYAEDGAACPLLRLNHIDVTPVELRVGERRYRYERSYPIKGHGAVMPKFLKEQMDQGKQVLIVERVPRFYVYLGQG